MMIIVKYNTVPFTTNSPLPILDPNLGFWRTNPINSPPLNKDILYPKSSVKISENWEKLNFERETHILDFTNL